MKGHKRQRSKGSWGLYVYDRTAKKYVTQTFHGSEDAADTELARLVAKVADGKKHASKKSSRATATFAQAANEWLADRRDSPHVGPSAYKQYEWIVRTKLVPVFGRDAPSTIESKDVKALRKDLLERRFSARTVRHVLSTAGMVFRFAVREGYADEDPCTDVERPQEGPSPDAPDPEDVKEFLAAAEAFGPPWGTLTRLTAVTGTRRGEVGALRVRDIDLGRGQVSVVQALGNDRTSRGVKGPKTPAGRRTMSIDAVTVEMLRRHLVWGEERAKAAEMPLPGLDSFLFSPEPDGSVPFHPHTITHRFAAIRALCSSTVRPHDLRRFTGTQQASGGIPMREMMGRHGWKDHRTALRYMTYVGATDRKVADLMGDILAESPPSS